MKEDAQQSAAAKKLNDRLAKIPGLEALMQNVTKRDDAADILAAMAEKLGGDKIAGSKILKGALELASAKEKEPEQKKPQAPQAQQAAAPAAGKSAAPAPAAPAAQPVKESFISVKAFVGYLFE